VIEVLRSMDADVTHPHPPGAVVSMIPYKSLGTPLRFRFYATMQATGSSASRIAYGIKVDWSSTFVVLGILVALGLINTMFLSMWVGVLAPLCSIAGIGWAVYDYAVGIPNRLAAQVQKKLAAPSSAQAEYSAPAPTPAPVASVEPQKPGSTGPYAAPLSSGTATASPLAPSDESDIVAKIEKLALLKTKGLISDAEFEQRRAELLDRL
jgi:hypothetical protein